MDFLYTKATGKTELSLLKTTRGLSPLLDGLGGLDSLLDDKIQSPSDKQDLTRRPWLGTGIKQGHVRCSQFDRSLEKLIGRGCRANAVDTLLNSRVTDVIQKLSLLKYDVKKLEIKCPLHTKGTKQ